MGAGKVAIIVAAATTAASAVAVGVGLALRKSQRAKLPPPVQKSLRTLQSMLSRKPASWYEKLPTFTLRNSLGMEVDICGMGAAITRMVVPDAKGRKVDVVLGYDEVEQYAKAEPCTYFGVIVGRCANRIANATFTLDKETYRLLANNGPHSLHGGAQGLHKRAWRGHEISGDGFTGVELVYESPTGEEGYPGSLYITVQYKLSKTSNELTTTITATTDEATPVNITQHAYFNLAGHSNGSILNHQLTIHGDHYLPVDPTLIPTGEVKPVKGTAFDFTAPHEIGERIAQVSGGYDHTYVLHGMGSQAKTLVKNGMASDKPKLAAVLKDIKSGRTLELLTTAPGLQFYSGNFLDGREGKAGAKYPQHSGLCLEPQGFPNAVNQASFPSVVLQPDQEYRHEIVYRFS